MASRIKRLDLGRFVQFSIKSKIVVALLSFGMPIIIAIGLLFYQKTKQSFIDRSVANLQAINSLKKKQIETIFADHKRNVLLYSQHRFLNESFSLVMRRATQNGLNSRGHLEAIHWEYQKNSILVVSYGYDEYFLVSEKGDVVLTDKKKFLVGENFNQPSYLKIGLTQALIRSKSGYFIGDFKISELDNYQPICYSGAPVESNLRVTETYKGVLIVGLKIDRFNRIMTDTSGLGKTGESYLVGPEYLLRTQSRSVGQLSILRTKAEHQAVKNAFSQKNGYIVGHNYLGFETISVYDRIEGEGAHNWAIVSEIHTSEALSDFYFIWNIIFFATFISLILLFFLANRVGRNISRPVVNVHNTINQLSQGILPKSPLKIRGRDAIAEMNTAINKLSEGLTKTAEFAHQIGNGNLDYNFEPLSEQDKLGHSLLQMKTNLITIGIDETKRKWTNEGLAMFNEIIRKYQNDPYQRNYQTLKFLINHLSACEGLFYKSTTDDNQQTVLNLAASYAPSLETTPKTLMIKSVNPIVAAFTEKAFVLLTEIPQSLGKITSGFGAAKPKMAAIIPVYNQLSNYGVFFIGSFNKIEDYQFEFLKTVANTLATAMSVAELNEKNKELLYQAQQQHRDLQNTQNYSRHKIEELSESNENTIQEINRKLRLIENYYQLIYFVEYTPDGIITSANNNFEILTNVNAKGNSDTITHADLFVAEMANMHIFDNTKNSSPLWVTEKLKADKSKILSGVYQFVPEFNCVLYAGIDQTTLALIKQRLNQASDTSSILAEQINQLLKSFEDKAETPEVFVELSKQVEKYLQTSQPNKGV